MRRTLYYLLKFALAQTVDFPYIIVLVVDPAIVCFLKILDKKQGCEVPTIPASH